MEIPAHYIAVAKFADGSIGYLGDPGDFSSAVDNYADWTYSRDDGEEVAVFRVDPPQNGKAGAFTEVTDDAEALILRRMRRKLPQPDVSDSWERLKSGADDARKRLREVVRNA